MASSIQGSALQWVLKKEKPNATSYSYTVIPSRGRLRQHLGNDCTSRRGHRLEPDSVPAGARGANLTAHHARNAAIVRASVYDAVNGIERRYTPIHVKPDAPHGASARAAAVQAAYVSLVNLYPTQQSTFDAARATSLDAILNKRGDDKKGDRDEEQERQKAVDRGVACGQEIADSIWT
jgi:hypothetical protein